MSLSRDTKARLQYNKGTDKRTAKKPKSMLRNIPVLYWTNYELMYIYNIYWRAPRDISYIDILLQYDMVWMLHSDPYGSHREQDIHYMTKHTVFRWDGNIISVNQYIRTFKQMQEHQKIPRDFLSVHSFIRRSVSNLLIKKKK